MGSADSVCSSTNLKITPETRSLSHFLQTLSAKRSKQSCCRHGTTTTGTTVLYMQMLWTWADNVPQNYLTTIRLVLDRRQCYQGQRVVVDIAQQAGKDLSGLYFVEATFDCFVVVAAAPPPPWSPLSEFFVGQMGRRCRPWTAGRTLRSGWTPNHLGDRDW